MARCPKSWEMYRRTLPFLGCGSSTLSKTPRDEDGEPAQVVRGRGCRVWDADGNGYIDFRNALGPVTLGYAVPEINRAVAAQLEDGIIFGHPHPLEGRVARLLVENIPCAEKVRFLKTGGEAIAACIKIARFATGRDIVLQCGYNGWLNTMSAPGGAPASIAAANPARGVPPGVSACHKVLPWGEPEPWRAAFAGFGREVAALVVACSYHDIEKGREFLPFLRRLSREHGALMIVDEIVTGFRLALGGAHEYFGFDPDLAVFAKGMANGMPISAYAGRRELIDVCARIGVSSTYGGETLSLAAAEAAIHFYREREVIAHLWAVGARFQDGVNRLFAGLGLDACVRGLPVCPAFVFGDPALAGPFFRACYRHGVSLYNIAYVNFSHQADDIDEALAAIGRAARELA